MLTTLFLAKAWGAFLVITSLAFLINPKGIKNVFKYMKAPDNIFIVGWLTLVIGILAVVAHNIWSGGWAIVITVLGWATLIKGSLRVAYPDVIAGIVTKFEKNSAESMKFIFFILLVLGICLIYVGMNGV